MTINVLISCMYQNDTSIIAKTNIQTDVVVVNQCDRDEIQEFDFTNRMGNSCHAKIVNTTQRGLSRSRNMAIENAWGDICLLCDDDEKLEDDYEKIIKEAYKHQTDRSVILFIVERKDLPKGKKYPDNERKVDFKQILQSSSVQVTFKRDIIREKNIQFDILLGSGSGNGGGEDNKFLIDARKANLGIYYVPQIIGAVMPGKSLWFKGFTKQYMIDRGWTTRRSLGTSRGFVYITLFALKHRKQYQESLNFFSAYGYLLQGFFENRIANKR